jgi:hypothetical protein
VQPIRPTFAQVADRSRRVAPLRAAVDEPMSREMWRESLARRLSAVDRYRVEGGSLLRLPGPQSFRGWRSDGMEAFARTFLGWSFLVASGPDDLPAGWEADRLTTALIRGVRETWPRPADNPQTLVESALVAIALHETAGLTWDRMAADDREAVLSWLGECLTVTYRTSNWLWFSVLVRTFVETHGDAVPGTPTPSTADLLDRIEQLYVGGGWYRDGQGREFDWYNAWAFHFYPFLWARMVPAAAGPWLPRWRGRLHDYLDDVRHLVGGSGAPVYQGRSATYRFAVLAPFWLGLLEQCSPSSPGETARLTRLVLHYFDDGRDALRVGWTRPFEPMRQVYTGAGSPYWALKGYVGLLVPASHSVWTAAEEPLPVERGDFTRVVQAPGWVLSGTTADGVVRVANHGTDGADGDQPRADMSSYGRLGYSTVTGPSYGGAGWPRNSPPDNSIVVHTADGARSTRTPFLLTSLDVAGASSTTRLHWAVAATRRERFADLRARLGARRTQLRAFSTASNYRGRASSFVAGPAVVMASVVHGSWEVRVACLVEAPAYRPGSEERVPLVEVTGWAVPGTRVIAATGGAPLRCGDAAGSGFWSIAAPVRGVTAASALRVIGNNPLAQRCVMPVLRGTWDAEGVVAALVGLTGDPAVVSAAGEGTTVVPRVEVTRTADDVALEVTWPDGSVATWTSKPAVTAGGRAPRVSWMLRPARDRAGPGPGRVAGTPLPSLTDERI